MKKSLFAFLILAVISFAAHSNENNKTFYIEGGHGYHLSEADSTTLLTPVMSFGIRKTFESDVFVQLRMNTWNKDDHSATWIGPSIGYRNNFENSKLFFEGSLGYGYLTKPDGNSPDGKGVLTTNQQFEILLGFGMYLKNGNDISLGLAHLSNCSNYCNRGEAYEPNPGKNWYRLSYGIRF